MLAVLAVAGLGVLLVLGADDEPVIVAAAVTASAAIVVAALTRAWTARAAVQAQHRAEVAPIYEALIQQYWDLLPPPGQAGPRPDVAAPLTPGEIALGDMHDKTTQKLLLWGSPGVIAGWAKYQERVRKIPVGTSDPWLWLDAFEDLLLVLRNDLGHDDRALVAGDLLRTFLSDVDKRPG